MTRIQTLPGLVLAAFLIGILAGNTSPAMAQADAIGAGGGWFDCDNDGDLDVCYVTPQGRIVLLIYNSALKQFVDNTDDAIPLGVQYPRPGLGVACGDVNNDGWSDIFITFTGANLLLLNNGDVTFTAVRAGLVGGVEGEVMSASAAMFDYDRDGFLDIYVANYEGHANQLFHNDGVDGTGLPHFTDLAVTLGMDLAKNGQSDWSLGLAVADYDNDGDSDLYVANDYNGLDPNGGFLSPGPNILYRNDINLDGTFTDVSKDAGVADAGWAMGTAFGDYDQDGYLDLFITNFWEDALLRNNGNGTFTNVTALVGMPTIRPDPADTSQCTVCNGWGTSFIDFDNDGDLDLQVTNGYITNGEGQDFNEANELWENIGRGGNGHVQFREVGRLAGVDDVGDGRGAAFADLNQDGFVDFMVFNNNYVAGPGVEYAPVRLLYINQKDGTFRDMGLSYRLRTEDVDALALPPQGDYAGNSWIQIRPVGTVSNRSGYGTRITVEAGGKTWIQDLGAGSYCSTNSSYLHFGLGQNEVVSRIKVQFPSGRVATLIDQPVNQILTVSETDATPVRLLSFVVLPSNNGPQVQWSWVDDGDLVAFSVSREQGGVTTILAPYLRPTGNEGTYLDEDAPLNQNLKYSLDALYRDGSSERLATVSFRWEEIRGLIPGQNYPNPFASRTAIPVASAVGGLVTIRIFDTGGRLIRQLESTISEGGGIVHWDGRNQSGRSVPAGTYFYRVNSAGSTLKMIRRP